MVPFLTSLVIYGPRCGRIDAPHPCASARCAKARWSFPRYDGAATEATGAARDIDNIVRRAPPGKALILTKARLPVAKKCGSLDIIWIEVRLDAPERLRGQSAKRGLTRTLGCTRIPCLASGLDVLRFRMTLASSNVSSSLLLRASGFQPCPL